MSFIASVESVVPVRLNTSKGSVDEPTAVATHNA
jgi:hypothetical protein